MLRAMYFGLWLHEPAASGCVSPVRGYRLLRSIANGLPGLRAPVMPGRVDRLHQQLKDGSSEWGEGSEEGWLALLSAALAVPRKWIPLTSERALSA